VQDLVVGGGVIGVACAYELANRGRDVVLLEAEEICSGCSHGNAGWLAVSHIHPIPAPGIVWQTLKWMLRGDSPFHIRPRFSLSLWIWLWRFTRHCNGAAAERGMKALAALHREAVSSAGELVDAEGLDCEFAQRGTLHCYQDPASLEKAREECAHVSEQGFGGVPLDSEEIHRREPALSDKVVGGIFYEVEADVVPDAFVKQLAARLERRGGRIRTRAPVTGFQTSNGRIQAVETGDETWTPQNVIIAAGSGSVALARRLGLSLSLQPGKGYSVSLPRPAICPQAPLYLPEVRVAVTPWGEQLRLGGTMELAGHGLDINQRRVDAIASGAQSYLRDLRVDGPRETWAGLRPLTIDGLPIIGRSERYSNLYWATGHGMLGLTQATVTARLISELIRGDRSSLDLTPFAPARCGG